MKRLNRIRHPRRAALAAFQRGRGWVNRMMTSWTRRFKEVIVTRFRRVARWAHGGVGHVFSFAQARLRPLVLLVLIAAVAVGVWGMISFWEWLRDGPDGLESGSTTVRNLGFVIAGVVALPLAIWRSLVAQRQANTAQQDLLNERYQRGAEMLGSEVLSVRLGGIYALQRLAEEHPHQYHVQIVRLLCAFVRNPTAVRNGGIGPANHDTGEVAETCEDGVGVRPRQDVEATMEAIATRSHMGVELERDAEFRLDLRDAKLGGLNLMNFMEVNLSWANLSFADMSRVNIRPLTDMSWIHAVSVNLSGACLDNVNLSVTQFIGADLSETLLSGANLSAAVFSDKDMDTPCKLTQAQLDKARADPDNPPKLDGVLDAKTGKQLVWRGKPCDNREKP